MYTLPGQASHHDNASWRLRLNEMLRDQLGSPERPKYIDLQQLGADLPLGFDKRLINNETCAGKAAVDLPTHCFDGFIERRFEGLLVRHIGLLIGGLNAILLGPFVEFIVRLRPSVDDGNTASELSYGFCDIKADPLSCFRTQSRYVIRVILLLLLTSTRDHEILVLQAEAVCHGDLTEFLLGSHIDQILTKRIPLTIIQKSQLLDPHVSRFHQIKATRQKKAFL